MTSHDPKLGICRPFVCLLETNGGMGVAQSGTGGTKATTTVERQVLDDRTSQLLAISFNKLPPAEQLTRVLEPRLKLREFGRGPCVSSFRVPQSRQLYVKAATRVWVPEAPLSMDMHGPQKTMLECTPGRLEDCFPLAAPVFRVHVVLEAETPDHKGRRNTSDGIQPTSDGIQPASHGIQPTSNGLNLVAMAPSMFV